MLLQVYYLTVFDFACYILFIHDVLHIYNAKSAYKTWFMGKNNAHTTCKRFMFWEEDGFYDIIPRKLLIPVPDWNGSVICPIKQTYTTICDVLCLELFIIVIPCKNNAHCSCFVVCCCSWVQAYFTHILHSVLLELLCDCLCASYWDILWLPLYQSNSPEEYK